jgi:hypothetical protein
VFKITVDKTDLAKFNAFVDGARAATNDRDAISGMIKVYGLYTDKNFLSRGTAFGHKWQPISNYTRKVREQRGQNPLMPPLQGSGWLKRVTGYELSRWNPGRSSATFTDAPVDPDSDGRTTMTVSVDPRRATLHMSGPKASHMTGDTSGVDIGLSRPGRYGAGYMPPRPFWGMNQSVVDTMSQAAVAGFFRAWSDHAEKAGSGRVNYSVPGMASLRWMVL